MRRKHLGHLHRMGRRQRGRGGDQEVEVGSERDGGDDLAADALQPSHAWPHLPDK